MKNAKRLVAWILVLCTLMSAGGAEAFAANNLKLPESVETIEEEAFANDQNVQGMIELPIKTRTVGDRAFSGTNAFALSVPAETESIGHQIGPGLIYVKAPGKNTSFAQDALQGVRYAFGDASGNMPGAGAEDFYPLSEIWEEEGLIYHITVGGAILLCVTDPDEIGNTLQIPERVGNTNVSSIAKDAFAGCSELQLINVPSAVRMDADALRSVPNAAVQYYSSSFDVVYIESDVNVAEAGDYVLWIARTTENADSYRFDLYDLGDDTAYQEGNHYTLISTSETGRANYCSVKLDHSGRFAMMVTCVSTDGAVAKRVSIPVTVNPGRIKVLSIFPDDITLNSGSNNTWTAEYEGGSGTETISFTMSLGDQVIASASETTLAAQNLAPGKYTLTFTVTDTTGNASTLSTSCTVVDEEAFSPAPPLLTSDNMSSVEAEAPSYELSDLEITWEESPSAMSYGVILQKRENDIWGKVHSCDQIQDLRYTISSSDLAVEEQTLFRVGLYGQNLGDGEPAWYYFSIQPSVLDRQVYIDNTTNTIWNQAAASESTRSFEILSMTDWTAAADSNWIHLRQNQDILVVSMDVNNSSAGRSATVSVTNGYTTSSLTIHQGCVFISPEITWPVMSEDPDRPTTVGTGILSYEFEKNDANAVLIEVFLKTDTDWSKVFWKYSSGTKCTFSESSTNKLVSGNDYRIRITSVWDDAYEANEIADTQLSREYYVTASDSANIITVNDRSSISLGMTDEYTHTPYFNVFASSMYSVTSDVEWLRLKVEPTYGLSITYAIASDNLTDSARTGHLFFTCEDKTAVVTVTQPSMLPRVSQPALSSNEKSPSSIPKNDLNIVAYGTEVKVEKKSGSSYVDAGITGTTKTSFRCLRVTVPSADLTTNTTYRVTVSYNGSEAYYYFKTSSSNTGYIYINDVGCKSWSAPASGETMQYTIKASSSWTASTDAGWLTVSQTSGSSTTGTSITVTASANDTESRRHGVITFKRGNYYTAYLVVEQAGNVTLSAAFVDTGTATIEVPATSGIYEVALSHTDELTLSPQASWITSRATANASSTTFDINVSKNDSGDFRSGSLIVTEDGRSVTLIVIQRPGISAPSLTSHTLSTDRDMPTFVPADREMILDWSSVAEANAYGVRINQLSPTKIILRKVFSASQTSFAIPDDLLTIGMSYSLRVISYNADGDAFYSDNHYFVYSQPDGVFINRSSAPVWENADDCGDSAEFTIMSSDSWQVDSCSSWLDLSASAGDSGSILVITAQENLGAARTGAVTIRCGDGSATLTVHQCAYMDEQFQPLLTPNYSDDMANPTVLPASTTEISATWDMLPQASYQLRIKQMKSASTSTTIVNSGSYDHIGSYSFSDLALEPGVLYSLELRRSCSRWNTTAMPYYFMLDQDAVELNVNKDDLYLDGNNDHITVKVTASGTWSASTDAEWLALGKNSFPDIEEYDDISWYSVYVGSGETGQLVMTSKVNNTGKARTATVTIRCGNLEKQILVHQSVNYTYAELENLSLSTSASNPTSIALDDLTLRWNASRGGTGNYEVTLKKKNGYSYEKIWTKTLSSLSTTIAKSYLEEGAFYQLFLGTEATGEDEIYGVRYFFKVQYENELVLDLNVDWSRISVDGYVYIRANAGGRSGNTYLYAYELVKDGWKISESTWTNLDRYNFLVEEPGTYCIHAYVKDSTDSTDTVAFADSSTITVSAENTARLTVEPNVWEAPVEGGTLAVNVNANFSWTASSSESWLTISQLSDQNLQLKASSNLDAAARVAVVTINSGKATETITVKQNGTQAIGTLALSESTWQLDTVFAEEKTITVTSSENWYIVPDSVPKWIRLSSTEGENGDALYLTCMANTGAARSASIAFISGNTSESLTVTQPGTSDAAQILSASVNSLTLVGIPVSLRINTKNADTVAVMVNGRIEGEPISVSNGFQNIMHTFETGGDQHIQLIPYRNGAMGTAFDMGTVHIRTFGNLKVPALNYERVMVQGATQTISWDAIPNAENYAVIVRYGNRVVDSWLIPSDTTSKDLTADTLADLGDYTVIVKAIAYGYDSSSTAAVFSVQMPRINFVITSPKMGDPYIKGDLMDIQVSNPDNYHIAVKVTPENPEDPIEWLPADGSTCSDTTIQQTFYFRPKSTQTYTFEAMAWADETRGSENRAWHDSSKQVQIAIQGPIIQSARIDGSEAAVRLRSEVNQMSVVTNNAVTSVSLFQDNSTEPIETKAGESAYQQDEYYRRTWQFDLTAPAAGRYHSYKVIASDSEKSIETKNEFYCVEDCEYRDIYSQSNGLAVYKYPTGRQKDQLGTINMMEKYHIMGYYGSYSYICGQDFRGFALSSGLSEQIVYDSSRIELGFIEDKSAGPQTVNTFVGAPKVALKWYSNKDQFNSSLVYRLTLQPEGRSAIITEMNLPGASWTFTNAGTYTLSVALVDKTTNTTLKSASSLTTYVIYQNKQEYIRQMSELQLEIIKRGTNAFDYAVKCFDVTDVQQTSDNPVTKIYQLAELKFDTLFELNHFKADDIAESILCGLAAAVPDAEPAELIQDRSAFSMILECLGVPFDLINGVAEGIKNAPINLSRDDLIRRIVESLQIKHYRGLNRVCEVTDQVGKGITVLTAATNIAETLVNACMVVDQFARVPDEQIEDVLQLYRQSNAPLLQEVAKTLEKYLTKEGRRAYVAEKLAWSSLEGIIEIGGSLGLDAMKEWVGGSILGGVALGVAAGVSIGTGIGDSALNAGDVAESATKAKWAVESLHLYMPELTVARDNFYGNPSAATYQALASAVLACQQLTMNAYTKMIDFMNQVDASWFHEAEAQTMMDYALSFQSCSNALMQELDQYWFMWLADECEQVQLVQAAVFH